MLSFEEARQRVVEAAPRLASETVALWSAAGRVLAEPLLAEHPLPPNDYSAMDGYALRCADLPQNSPHVLRVRGESRAGQGLPQLSRGAACRIFTGAPIPSGADSVVLQEDVDLDEKTESITLRAVPRRGDNIRRRGEDIEAGSVALAAGTRLGAYQLGLAAALDRSTLRVARRPRVTVLCTGDELRAPGSAPKPDTLPESNSIVLATLATHAGADVTVVPPSGDDRAHLTARVEEALSSCDVLVTVGGVSVGDYDVVRPALANAGVAIDFWKVAMKPGKPFLLGRRGEQRILGLPGNPISAQTTFTLFGLPTLRAMQGDASPPSKLTRTLSAPLRQKAGRIGFYRARLDGDTVTPLSGQASGSTTGMAWSDALIVMPADRTALDAGARVSVMPLPEC